MVCVRIEVIKNTFEDICRLLFVDEEMKSMAKSWPSHLKCVRVGQLIVAIWFDLGDVQSGLLSSSDGVCRLAYRKKHISTAIQFDYI